MPKHERRDILGNYVWSPRCVKTVYPFVVLTSSSSFSLPGGNFDRGEEMFLGRREKMEGELGDGSHVTSALSESGTGCAAPGSPWRGTGPSWGDSLHLEMVPRVDQCRWLLCDRRLG